MSRQIQTFRSPYEVRKTLAEQTVSPLELAAWALLSHEAMAHIRLSEIRQGGLVARQARGLR